MLERLIIDRRDLMVVPQRHGYPESPVTAL
jgi:hypothetical protein